MWKDPIIEEIRRVREAYAARFDHDLEAMFHHLREREEEERRRGREFVSFPPRCPEKPRNSAP